jgi:ATP-dependent exoDNAse (exonuclease V) alpha subunit
VTVRNQDVEVLNKGIRELLKANGLLKGKEFLISHEGVLEGSNKNAAQTYMAGDRIIFKANDKANSRSFSKLAYARGFEGDSERRTGVYSSV